MSRGLAGPGLPVSKLRVTGSAALSRRTRRREPAGAVPQHGHSATGTGRTSLSAAACGPAAAATAAAPAAPGRTRAPWAVPVLAYVAQGELAGWRVPRLSTPAVATSSARLGSVTRQLCNGPNDAWPGVTA